MASIVFDASAIIALIRAEKGWNRVAEAMPKAVMCAVNVSEVSAKLAEWGSDRASIEKTRAVLADLIEPFDAELAWQAGQLRPVTKSHGLSLGDRACLALAQKLGVPAMTADKAWAKLDIGIKIEVIR